MEGKPRMAIEPFADLQVFVGRIVVEDDMDSLFGWDLRLDLVEKADELLMPVLLHAASYDLAFEHVEGSKQGGGAVALVVVCHGGDAPLLEGQAWLGAVERLDLAFLVDREHDGMLGRIDVKPHHVMQLLNEVGVVRELELPDTVRLQAVRSPDTLNRAGADAGLLRHHGGSPVRGLSWRIGLRECHHARCNVRSERRNARGACLVAQQTLEALLHEAFLPAPDAGLGLAGLVHDLIGAEPVCAQRDDLSPPHLLLRHVAIPHERLQTEAVGRSNDDGNTSSHAPDSHAIGASGIPNGIQMSDLIH